MKLRRGKQAPAQRQEPGRQRRNTLDSTRPAAFSYHAQRAERPDAPGRQQPSAVQSRSHLLTAQFWFRRSGLLIAVGVGLLCLISILSLSAQPRVVLLNSDVNQRAFRSSDQYQQAASTFLAGSVWNRNKITVNSGAASHDLAQRFPELSSVTITLPLIGHRPIYYLEANKPGFVLHAANGTFVLDANGVALVAQDVSNSDQAARLPSLTDQTGIHVTAGQQVISRSQAAFMSTIIDDLAAKQVTVQNLILPARAVQELDVQVADAPYIIKFNLHDTTTARQQVGTYLATAHNLAGQKQTPTQYIDVRVSGRAYYL